ncbi:MAG: DsbA family protein [Polaromonas sp.]|uniref:2-hydroxychromene-2-carboxylate isomerase n=1 Tax=Polaromonas sp. TaxID=1869339 RepID=UPI002488E31D|nr:DsbA family protein [Polaromonas sp.]MDI1269413.1 DsbA family protein [Polaromonas sp.]
MTETKKPIQFYFDFISPFGYFASLRIDELARRYGREVEWNSMLLGVSVMKVMGLPPIIDLPLKGPYIVRDAKRYARRHGVSFERESAMPGARPLEAGRAYAWAKTVDPIRAKRLAAGLFESYFVNCSDIGDSLLVEQCISRAGLSVDAYRHQRWQGVPKALLEKNVEASLDNGVFGSPFFIVDGEPFFGLEKMPDLEDWLKTGGW